MHERGDGRRDARPDLGHRASGLVPFVVARRPGRIVKIGYKGIDTTEMVVAGHKIGVEQILGATPARGFFQTMDGVEVDRVNVAAHVRPGVGCPDGLPSAPAAA